MAASSDEDDVSCSSGLTKGSNTSNDPFNTALEKVMVSMDKRHERTSNSSIEDDEDHDGDENGVAVIDVHQEDDDATTTKSKLSEELAKATGGERSIASRLYDQVASRLNKTSFIPQIPTLDIFRSGPITAERLKKAQKDQLCVLHYLYAFRRVETKEIASFLNNPKIHKDDAMQSIGTVFKLDTLTQVAFQAWTGLFFNLSWSGRRDVLSVFLTEISDSKTYWGVKEERSELGGAIFDPIFVKAKNQHYTDRKLELQNTVESMRSSHAAQGDAEEVELKAEEEELKAMKKDLQEEVYQLRAKKRSLKVIQAELKRKRSRAEEAKISRVTMQQQAQQEFDDVVKEEQTNKKKRRLE
eukprot:CAMPEP_0198134192 /NCGR_PEP_ID=MMETSP1442-20131203/59948_1 /TAXON_ID= /ORGANISM="Craspedostauros australis, Strain CCMP3328" /LENGTH=355 /DNA_ID=CAMNT_0043795333 /DNA_START=819 /DNA_END=1886 /DNA_ORIENTATION=-